jgi:hypothetical protein
LRWADPPFKEPYKDVYKVSVVSEVKSELEEAEGLIPEKDKNLPLSAFKYFFPDR